MRHILLAAALTLAPAAASAASHTEARGTAAAPAQYAPLPSTATPPERLARMREVMGMMKGFNGTWRGRSLARIPNAPVRDLTATYRVGEMLGGTVRVGEGRSFGPDGAVALNGFTVVQHDPATGRTSLRLQYGGRIYDHALTVVPDGYDFIIRPPGENMELRYKVRVVNGVWTEEGVRHAPGVEPMPYFNMELRRVGDSDWPAAGAIERP